MRDRLAFQPAPGLLQPGYATLRSWGRDLLIAELQDANIMLEAIANVVDEIRDLVTQRARLVEIPQPGYGPARISSK